jgi:uncharacterized membrane protein YjgN (DUF898 family)
MNDMSTGTAEREERPGSSFAFTGSWQEFLPIALANLMLMIVTLGIYRFWAKARERRYLWSRTRFLDDSFEWTGTGAEMFVGFLIVFLVLIPFFFLGQLAIEALVLRGRTIEAGIVATAFYGVILYLIGVAGLRALRYRLSRTYWRGIRGGSDDNGWRYGLSYVWKMAVGFLVFGLLIPWAMISLWNERWNKMSFGQHPFRAVASPNGLMLRYVLIYAVLIGGMVLVGLVAGGLFMAFRGDEQGAAGAATIFLGIMFIYLAFLLASLSYYAAFYRQVASATTLADLEFRFTARTKDWLKLILGNIALVIVTLGVGLLFLGYRNWSFVVRHMKSRGEFDAEVLRQSQTSSRGDAEGLADAFDIGAI